MNILEAINSGKPFNHCDMIGAFMLVESGGEKHLVHHDNIENFADMDFIRAHVHATQTKWCIQNLSLADILRTDWRLT